MRYVLYIGNETLVDLSKELEFLKSYSELMRTRFDEKLELEINFPETVAGKVPPLLFISLLENAFKHGIDPVSTSHITASAELKDHKIHFVLVNSYYPKSNIDESGSGIGVQNLKKRLAYLFEAESYILTHELRGDKYYSELIIPVE
jgi:LytS/YehU family sensor histidine kinase